MIDSKIGDFIQEQMTPKNRLKFCAYLATSSLEGIPNVVPVGWLNIIDDKTIVIADNFFNKTRENLGKNPKVALVISDEETMEGYQMKGSAEIVTQGDIYEDTKQRIIELSKKFGIDPPIKCHAAVLIKVEEIYTVKPGPNAGKRIK